jgi:hypothetical protein
MPSRFFLSALLLALPLAAQTRTLLAPPPEVTDAAARALAEVQRQVAPKT